MRIVNFPLPSRAHPPPDLCASKLRKPSAPCDSFLKLPTAAAGRRRSWRETQTPAQRKRSLPASCFCWRTTGRRLGRTLAPHSHARHGGGRERGCGSRLRAAPDAAAARRPRTSTQCPLAAARGRRGSRSLSEAGPTPRVGLRAACPSPTRFDAFHPFLVNWRRTPSARRQPLHSTASAPLSELPSCLQKHSTSTPQNFPPTPRAAKLQLSTCRSRAGWARFGVPLRGPSTKSGDLLVPRVAARITRPLASAGRGQ